MFRGVIPIVATPFTRDGAVDKESFKRVVRYCLAAGAHGLAFPANASEFFTLSADERRDLTETLIETVAGQVPVIIGATAANKDDAVAFAQHAQAAGADGLLLMVSAAFAGRPAEVAAYLRAVADATDLPIMLQNAQAPIGADLDVETVAQLLREIPQIGYVKEERNPSGQMITRIKQAAGDRPVGVFGGDGGRSIINELLRGVDGTMPAVEFVELYVELFRRYEGGDTAGAVDVFEAMLPILNVQRVFRWAATKRILVWRGIIADDFVRAPNAPRLDDTDAAELRMWYDRIRHRLIDAPN